MKSKFNKTTLSTCNAFIGLALAISTTTASADISVVRTAAISHVNSTKNGFATAHLGTTARTFDTTGVSKLVVVFSGEPGNNNQVLTITGVSFNGTPMTKAVNDNTRVTSSNDCGDVAIYYLDNPAVATAGTFSFTASSTSGAINGGIATILGISGAAPGVGITAKTSTSSPSAASTPSTSITTSGPNSLVIAAVQNSGTNNSAGTPTATAPLIQIHSGNWGSQWGSLASARQTVIASGATITPTFSTAAGGNIHVIAAEFKDATFTPITKADNTDDLNLTNSWVGAAVPGLGDVAVWDSTVTTANTTSLGANIAFGGIKILDPGGAVTINAGNTLTLGGPAIDLDLSTATQNLTVNSDLAMSAPHIWDVAASRTLTLGGAVSGAQPVIKQGLGAVTLGGASTYTGDTTVTAGSLTVSGSLIGSTTLGNLVVSDTAGNNAVVNIGGNMTFNRLQVGTITGAAGAVNLSAGTVTAGADNELTFTFGAGAATGGYGSLRMTGGTINTSRFQFGGQNVAAQNGVGVGLISNGTVNASSWVILSRFGTSPGTIGSLTVATGGVLNHTSATAGQNLALGWQGAGRAELNLTGGTITSASGRVMAYGGGGATWTGTGIVNLNAGTLTTTAVTSQGTGASSYLNFAGGTIKAVSTQANFLPALTGVYVNGAFGAFSGGAVIDTNGVNITIPAALITPTGNGVATIPVTSGGSGYIGAPAISITDGGAGFGATAIANMTDDGTGNGTFTIDSITITNPGNNYTAPVASLVGGGNGVTAATLGALTTAANTSGGLTKNGFGTLTLNGANTFTGATSVSDGSLVVNGSLASSAVSLASVATLGGVGSLAGTVTVDSGAQITAGNGTSGTLSTQNLTFSGTGAINVGPLGNYTTNPAIDTPGVLTLNGGAGAVTLNLNTAPVASGTYRLVRAASGIADASGFTLGTAPTPVGRQAAGTLQYDGGTNTVTYTTGGTYPIWSGAQSSEWSTNSISPSKNWQLADMSGGTDFIANDDVLFDNSGTLKTVDISNGDVFPSVVSFTNTGINDYTLQGINGIAGTAVLIKTGSGKLTITNTNSHTGGTTISSGILAFANGSLGTSGPITVNGGTLQWDGANIQDISSRLTLVNATTATLDTNGNDVTLASAFGGGTSGGIAKVGNGTLTLSAANTFTGLTTISSGTLKIGNAGALGTGTGTSDGTIIASGATLDLGGIGSGTSNQSGSVGAERITASGAGVGGNGAILSSAAIPSNFIGVRNLSLAGDTTLGFSNRWDVGSNNAALPSSLVGGGYTLNVLGTAAAAQVSFNFLGETDLGDINVNLGATAATNIMYLQGSTTLGRPANTVTILGGSTLDVFTNSTLTSIDKKFDLDNGVLRISKAGAMPLLGTIELTGAGTITANAATVEITSSNEISGAGSLTKTGAGTLALTGTNIFTGTTTVSAGGLVVGANDALGTTAGNTTLAAGTALGFTGGINYSTAETIIGSGAGNAATAGVFAVGSRGFVQSVSGSNSFAGAIQINATGVSRFGTQTGASLALSGPITMFDTTTGVTVLFRVGDTDGDFVTLSNSGNSWDTQTQIFTGNAGTGAGVRLGVTNALPTATPLVGFAGSGTGTTLDLASFSQEVAGLSNTGANANLRITNSVGSSTSVLTLTNAADLNSGANVVIADGAGVVAVVKAGSFTQTLSALNTFSGNLTISDGILVAGVQGTGAASAIGQADIGSRTITVNTGATLRSDVGSLFNNNFASDPANLPAINLAGGTLTNAGTLKNSALGNVTLTAGTLSATVGSPAGGANSGEGYGSWNLNGTITSTGASFISSTTAVGIPITLSAATGTTTIFDVQSDTLTVSAPLGQVTRVGDERISGLTKSGAGTLTLTGANTYTGATSVTVGTLALVGGSQTSPITVSASASLGFTLGSPTTSTSTFNLSTGTIKITGTPTLASHTLISSSAGITGTPVIDAPITGYELKVVGNTLVLQQAGYAAWAAVNAIGSAANLDKDGDGVNNAVEYVLGGDVNTNDLSKLPQSTIVGTDMIFTFLRDVDTIDGSTAVTIEVGTTLAAWPSVYTVGADTADSTPGVVVTEDSSPGFDTITLTVPMGTDPKKFGRLKVVVPD